MHNRGDFVAFRQQPWTERLKSRPATPPDGTPSPRQIAWQATGRPSNPNLGSCADLRRGGGCRAGDVFAFRLHLNLSATGSLYFLIVVMVSAYVGFWEASVTSLVAVNCLNYFFVPPVLTWRVSDPQDWVALATFEITALTVSRLSTRVQGQGEERRRGSGAGGEALRIEPPHSPSRSPPDDRAADRVPHSGDIPNGIRGSVRRRAGATWTRPVPGQAISKNSRATPISRTARWQGADAHAWAHVLRLG